MRTLFYSHDSYGLGHVRRSISIADSLLRNIPGSSALMLTGAPRAHYFHYPPRCDYVKLPSVTKAPDGRYVSGGIDMSLERTIRLRSRLIHETASWFHPQVVLVDHAPLGLCGEVLPTLGALSRFRPRAHRVLGLRDVIDEPKVVKAAWAREGVIEVLRSCYDLILVYGQQEMFDPIRAYDLPPDVARKIEFVGYIRREGKKIETMDLRSRFAPRTGQLVVVTLGGGGDGNVLLRSFFEGYEALGKSSPFEVVAVTGPLMSPKKRARFQAWASKLEGVTVLEYMNELPDLFEASSFVVSMGGYNTVCELACAGARALIVPRVFPRKEQLFRVRLLADRGMVRFLTPKEATPSALMREVSRGLKGPRPPRGWGLDFRGLEKTVRGLRSPMPHFAFPLAVGTAPPA